MASRWRVVLPLLGSLVTAQARAGSLDDVERASGPKHERAERSRPSSDGSARSNVSAASTSCEDDDACSGFGQFVGVALFYALVLPIALPRQLDDPCAHAYAAWPTDAGFFRRAPWDEGCGGDAPSTRPALGDLVRKLAGNVAAEGAYAQRGVWGGSLSGQLLLPHRLELASRVSLLADFSERPVDQAVLSHASLAYRFAQGPRFAFRLGVGLRTFYLHERRVGPDVQYGISVFGRHGLRWDAEAHAGALGKAFAGEARSTLGVMIGPVELFGGYGYFHVRSGAAQATLHGPVLGLRLWL